MTATPRYGSKSVSWGGDKPPASPPWSARLPEAARGPVWGEQASLVTLRTLRGSQKLAEGKWSEARANFPQEAHSGISASEPCGLRAGWAFLREAPGEGRPWRKTQAVALMNLSPSPPDCSGPCRGLRLGGWRRGPGITGLRSLSKDQTLSKNNSTLIHVLGLPDTVEITRWSQRNLVHRLSPKWSSHAAGPHPGLRLHGMARPWPARARPAPREAAARRQLPGQGGADAQGDRGPEPAGGAPVSRPLAASALKWQRKVVRLDIFFKNKWN